MSNTRADLWLGAIAVTALVATAVPAYALTVWEAPKTGDSAQRFADPDEALQQSARPNAHSSQSQRGWNFEFGAAPRDGSQDPRFSNIPGFQPYVPGPPQIPGSPYRTR